MEIGSTSPQEQAAELRDQAMAVRNRANLLTAQPVLEHKKVGHERNIRELHELADSYEAHAKTIEREIVREQDGHDVPTERPTLRVITGGATLPQPSTDSPTRDH